MREELDDVDSRLRVSTSIKQVLFYVDKNFILCDNYPKGHGDLFRDCIDTYHPGLLLLHVERASGSRQDLHVEGEEVVHINCPNWIEFLDEHMQTSGDKILQDNISIILSSLEMMVLARFCFVIKITVCLLTLWLADNSHILDD